MNQITISKLSLKVLKETTWRSEDIRHDLDSFTVHNKIPKYRQKWRYRQKGISLGDYRVPKTAYRKANDVSDISGRNDCGTGRSHGLSTEYDDDNDCD